MIVALATAKGFVDPDAPALLGALAALGVTAEERQWDDERADWDAYDAVLVRSTWDYSSRVAEFLDWAAGVPRLLNPLEVLRYSSDKHYLGDLAARGHRVVATTFCDVGEHPVFPDGDVVVKPSVGAGSALAARYAPGAHDDARAHVASLHAKGRDALVQPYVAAVDEVGERALVFLGGAYSHAMTKAAMLNVPDDARDRDFRVRAMSVAQGERDAIELARDILEDTGHGDLAYARVDLVRDEGHWAVMELELVEPWLYLSYHEGAAERLARAVLARVT